MTASKNIEARDTGPFAMPADVMKYISKSDLRDLVEFLAEQKADGPAETSK